MVSFSSHGELSERFKEPVLKTGDSERNLGFESLTLRQKWGGTTLVVPQFLDGEIGVVFQYWEMDCLS